MEDSSTLIPPNRSTQVLLITWLTSLNCRKFPAHQYPLPICLRHKPTVTRSWADKELSLGLIRRISLIVNSSRRTESEMSTAEIRMRQSDSLPSSKGVVSHGTGETRDYVGQEHKRKKPRTCTLGVSRLLVCQRRFRVKERLPRQDSNLRQGG